MKTTEKIRVHTRWMIRRDMPEVVAIEAATPLPWSEEDYLRVLRVRNCIGMVAEGHRERIVGQMVYELRKYELAVLRFTVHPGLHRCGIASQMLAKLVGKLSTHRRRRIVANVREDALPAQLCLRSNGFRAVNVLRGHEEDGATVYRMVYTLQD